jgi:creatinine amidohydrolase
MTEWRYSRMTWPQLARAAEQDRVVLVPCGAIEEHGHHLPVDTDLFIAESICRAVGERVPDEVLVLPALSFGYESLHLDFPGTIGIPWDVYVRYGLAVVGSLNRSGFARTILVNGHGGNDALLHTIAREAMAERPGTVSTALTWFQLSDVREAFNAVRETAVTSHACELETSAYLALDESGVAMERATAVDASQVSPHFWRDLLGRPNTPGAKSPLPLMEPWSGVTPSGVRGDPRPATAQKGRKALEAATAEIVEIVREFRQRTIVTLQRDKGNADGAA